MHMKKVPGDPLTEDVPCICWVQLRLVPVSDMLLVIWFGAVSLLTNL